MRIATLPSPAIYRPPTIGLRQAARGARHGNDGAPACAAVRNKACNVRVTPRAN